MGQGVAVEPGGHLGLDLQPVADHCGDQLGDLPWGRLAEGQAHRSGGAARLVGVGDALGQQHQVKAVAPVDQPAQLREAPASSVARQAHLLGESREHRSGCLHGVDGVAPG
jgi:hypothetical protein